ncbi:MAG: hypothetical protein GC153_03450 [Alphaproteobacteria bacterium]|nr:hypothetical protein [Alphaproteobacteria bacterium]
MFALKKSQGESKSAQKSAKRNPLSLLLGRKASDDADAMPEIDVAAGLSRILKSTPAPPENQDAVSIDPIREALASIEAALYSIDTVRDIIEQAYEVALSAQEVQDAGGRALLAESYDELRLSINKTIDGLDERAASLIGKTQRNLDVKLGGKAHYSVSPTRLDVSARGLNLEPPRDAFATFEEITEVLGQLDSALKKADRAAAGYCRDAQFLIARMAQAAAAA